MLGGEKVCELAHNNNLYPFIALVFTGICKGNFSTPHEPNKRTVLVGDRTIKW